MPPVPGDLPSHLAFSGYHDRRLHLGVAGSVAAFRALDLLRWWRRAGAAVTVCMTEAAQAFVTPLAFQALGAAQVDTRMYPAGDSPFAHLAPGQEAHAFVIAPATANILGKLAHGLADDMLACQAMAYPGPLVLAPAMNPNMWLNPATQANWRLLGERDAILVEPDSGEVACGDLGQGRLARLELVYLHGLRAMTPQDLAGQRVLVTLGPTREFFDPVRFWSNPSTGTMGASLAVAAWLRGADVTAVTGPVSLWTPPGVTRVDVTSAQQMHDACADCWPTMDAGLFTAAVADFAPEPYGETKFKKTDAAPLSVSFTRNPDILATLSAARRPTSPQRILGFAAETGDLAAHARDKLTRKNMDLIAANLATAPDAGFGSATNVVSVLDRHGREETWPTLPKPEVAWRLLDWLFRM